MRGAMDGMDDRVLGGWAFREGAAPLEVTLHYGEAVLLTTTATLPRRDVEQVFGRLGCGFGFPVEAVVGAVRREEDRGAPPSPLRATAAGEELVGSTPPCRADDLANATALAVARALRL